MGNLIGLQDVMDKTLVMNRETGKWALIAASNREHIVALIEEQHDRAFSPQAMHLRSALEESGFTFTSQHVEHGLNTLILKITKVCNYRCSYCYDMEPDDKLVHIPVQVAEHSIAEAVEICRDKLTIIFHGGEPTLFPELIKHLVGFAREQGVKYGKHITFYGQTNLSRLSDDFVAFSR